MQFWLIEKIRLRTEGCVPVYGGTRREDKTSPDFKAFGARGGGAPRRPGLLELLLEPVEAGDVKDTTAVNGNYTIEIRSRIDRTNLVLRS